MVIYLFTTCAYVQDAHLWPTGFPTSTGRYPHGVYFFFGMTFSQQKGISIDLTPAVTDFTTLVLQWSAREPEMDIRVFPVRRYALGRVSGRVMGCVGHSFLRRWLNRSGKHVLPLKLLLL